MVVGKTGLLTRDAVQNAWAFPPVLAVAQQAFTVAHSCGAVAESHRASRSSRHICSVIDS
jgi:hypothetical protein